MTAPANAFSDPIGWEETLPIRPSSPAWRCLVRSLYGAPLAADELELWRSLTGRTTPASDGYAELLVVAGRRAGKSETCARLAVFEALHGGHQIALAPGQVGIIPIISPLREQSLEILNYAKGLAALPAVRRHVESTSATSIRFRTGIELRVMTADAVAVSGPTVVAALLDEFAKFPGDDAAVPDREIIASLRPALAPLRGAPPRRLIGITSAWIDDGIAYETDRDHFGRDASPVLVAHGGTDLFNPSIDARWLARERLRIGERVFAREYLGAWSAATTDGWFGAIDGAVDPVLRHPPRPGVSYYAAIDAGFSSDAFALAIAHREFDSTRNGAPMTVLDGTWAWRGNSREALVVTDVIARVRDVLREYGVWSVYADQFAFAPLAELFSRAGVWLRQEAWTAQNKLPRFARVRSELSAGLLRLPNDPDLLRELAGIRSTLLRSGVERISGRRDDRVHAAVMALAFAMDAEPQWGVAGEHDRVISLPNEWRASARRRPAWQVA